MEGINRVILLGNLGADPELRFTQASQAVLNIRLATTRSWFDKESQARKEETEWHNVVVWGTRAEALAKILTKGSAIAVEGRLKTTSYEKDGVTKYTTSVVADDVHLCGGRPANGGGAPTSPGAAAPAPSPAAAAPRARAPF